MSQELPLVPDSTAIAKLKKGPVEVEVGLFEINPEYSEGEDPVENLKNMYVKKDSIKAWLHPLTWTERDFIRADVMKVFRFWKEHDGEDKEIARTMADEAVKRLVVFFSLKRGPEREAKRLFDNQEEILDFHPPTLAELNQRYDSEFGLTEKERGNLLRARSLKTSSALPVSSPAPPSSGGNSPS